MRSMIKNNFSWVLPSVIILSVLWLGIFSVIAMNHGVAMHNGCPIDFIGEGSSSQPMGSNFCTTIHMGMIQEISHAIPGSFGTGAGLVIAITLLASLIVRARDGDEHARALMRVRYRDRFDKDSHSFFSQIKQWISLYKKGDLVYCPA